MIFTTLCVFLLLELLWTVFGFYMCMRAAWLAKTLSKTAIGIVSDVLFNLVASLIFLQRPRTWTFSMRIQQLVNSGAGWRKTLALWAAGLLNSVSLGGPHSNIASKA